MGLFDAKFLVVILGFIFLATGAAGISGYTFTYAQGFSYFSDDPQACVNCHTLGGAKEGGLVTLEQMTSALTVAVESPAQGRRVITVPEIRAACA